MTTLFKEIENRGYIDRFLEAYKSGNRFVVFDVETMQGKGTDNQHIVEIGAVEAGKDFSKNPKTFQRLLHFNTDDWRQYWYCFKIHKISKKKLLSGNDRETTTREFLEFIKGATLITHTNVDIRAVRREISRHEFLKEEWYENEIWDNYFDSHKLAKYILPGLKELGSGYSVSKLTEYFKLTNENAHRALEDSVVTKKIVAKLIGVQLRNCY